jgi:hypothetical protein
MSILEKVKIKQTCFKEKRETMNLPTKHNARTSTPRSWKKFQGTSKLTSIELEGDLRMWKNAQDATFVLVERFNGSINKQAITRYGCATLSKEGGNIGKGWEEEVLTPTTSANYKSKDDMTIACIMEIAKKHHEKETAYMIFTNNDTAVKYFANTGSSVCIYRISSQLEFVSRAKKHLAGSIRKVHKEKVVEKRQKARVVKLEERTMVRAKKGKRKISRTNDEKKRKRKYSPPKLRLV